MPESTRRSGWESQSPWLSMRLRNFRLFQDTESLELAPLTLLFGRNSSGKTSLLRAPLLFKQMLLQTSVGGGVPLAGSYVDFGSYSDLVRGGDTSLDIVLRVAGVLDDKARILHARLAAHALEIALPTLAVRWI